MKNYPNENKVLNAIRISKKFVSEEIFYALKDFDGTKALYFIGNMPSPNPFNNDSLKIEHFEAVINGLKEAIGKEREKYEILLQEFLK